MTQEIQNLVDDLSRVIIPLTGLLGIIGSSVAVIITLRQIKLKSIEQTENLRNQNIESEIKLVKLLTEIMDIAHSRGETEISREIIEHIIAKTKNIDDETERSKMVKIINETAFLTKPKGLAAQDAAIAAIYTLGINHKVLFEPALKGLESLSKFKEIAKEYCELMKEVKKKIT